MNLDRRLYYCTTTIKISYNGQLFPTCFVNLKDIILQRLSKQCDTPHKPAVDLALTTMTSVASSINNMKRKHEHAVRVHEIQSQLYGWTGPDLTTLGELIAEGSFRVNGARGRRHVLLFDKILLMAKKKQDGALAYKFHIEVSCRLHQEFTL